MKKLFAIVIAGALALLVSGCGSAAFPVNGVLFTQAKGPVTATSNGSGSKEGRAECVSYLSLVALGDCSVETAAKNGGISQIKSVDSDVFNILGLYTKYTTVVKGN